MKVVSFPSSMAVPALGQGTWRMGEVPSQRKAEVAALRLGLDLGMTLIDTAEMYGSGGAEEIVREALAGRRDEAFVVSKVLPSNASRTATIRACEASLKRLGTDRIDLYLLHWRGGVPLTETVEQFDRLQNDGKILGWGVSNFDTDDMDELAALPSSGACQTNQVLYNLSERGIEFDLAKWQAARGIPVMAYSPVAQGDFSDDQRLAAIAARHHATTAQIALAWVLSQPNMIAIPKATNLDHVRANRAAADIVLSATDFAELDRAFPPPAKKQPLAII